MLFILLSTIFLFTVFSGFSSLINNSYNKEKFLSIELVAGIFIVGLSSAYLSILFPLNIYTELIILAVGIFLFIYHRKIKWIKRISQFPKSLFFISVILLFVSSMNAYIFDTFSYYFPTIKWLDDYGLVKGLANFDFNLGQTSLWHILSATFNQTIDPYYKINFFITFVFLLFVYETKKYILLFALPFSYLFIASPSPDLPVILFSIIAIINYNLYKSKASICLGMTIGAMLIVIKPIAFVLAIYFFVLWLIDVKNKHYKEILIVISIGLLFVLKNIILTANITFPLSYGSLSNLNYSIPKEIYYLSSVDGRYSILPHVESINYEDFKKWSSIEYYTYLFKNINLSIFLYLFIAFVNFIFIVYSIIKKEKENILLSILMFLKVAVFFIISIQYRFILDNFLIISSLILVQYTVRIIKIGIPIFITSVLFVLSSNVFDNNGLPNFMRGISKYRISNVLQPKLYIAQTKEIKYSNFNANYVTNTIFSLNAPQPALNKILLNRYNIQGYYPKLINEKNIKEGFILDKKVVVLKKDSK
ncbi:hypothetical protein SAMN05443634_103287 [Chishuiella changwenlii]|uniref:DUF8201 domain-containing protein n=1 Tax=Chishuiella changwenlii TaxID=1434701 RepID=A0A1M6VEB3_9FLAO|nr:hypothetical protein [Chishuiella changwenlii]GGF10390.1 hypothetical protein GCM10010984_29390 [Chishuiella changwenlii]SHK79704.1 hypothetical protein SAMN05443634_103287 [Chishuiella changwenlii]